MIWVTCWPSTSMGLASSSLSCCSLSSRLASLTLFEEIWEFATEMGAWVYPRSLSKIVLYANNASNPATIHSSGFLSTLFRFIRLGPGGLDPPWLGGSCDTRHHDLDNPWCLDTRPIRVPSAAAFIPCEPLAGQRAIPRPGSRPASTPVTLARAVRHTAHHLAQPRPQRGRVGGSDRNPLTTVRTCAGEAEVAPGRGVEPGQHAGPLLGPDLRTAVRCQLTAPLPGLPRDASVGLARVGRDAFAQRRPPRRRGLPTAPAGVFFLTRRRRQRNRDADRRGAQR